MLRPAAATAVTALVTAICMLTPVGALATSTEFGDRCSGNATQAGTVLGLNNGVMDGTFGESTGPWELRGSKEAVITRWKAQVGPGLAPLPQQLVAWQESDEQVAHLLGESSVETLHEGANEFTTRIPVSEYTRIGLRGSEGTLFCEALSGPNHLIGVVAGEFPVGASREFQVQLAKGVPVVAIAEPDFDADGYGDETQDQCSFQAWTHGPCEAFGIVTPGRRVTRQAIWVQLEATMAGTASVTGTISLPRRNGIQAVELTPVDVALPAKASVTVRVQIPRGVRRYLAKLPRKKRVRVELLAVGTSEHGNEARALRRFGIKGYKRGPLSGRGH
ncbi:MAG TPA: hypothetical protein VFU16_07480 [Solirubrobacterales bacterium]|nr:hypothetical protein [Solirubrobacterales bacterium]